MKRLGLVTVVSIGIAAAVFAQAGQRAATTPAAVAQGDWQNINRDSGATRFSPLTQINAGNVAKLAQVWTFPGAGGSSVPVVVNGVMYLSAGRRVVAVDGDTGKECSHILDFAMHRCLAAAIPALISAIAVFSL